MSSLMKRNNYKNVVKGLRKFTSSKTNEEIVKESKKNCFIFLEDANSEEVEQDFESSNELTVQKLSREKKGVNFDDLPEDVLYIILEFVPYNKRIAILKHKYNKSAIKLKLKKMSENIEGIKKLWSCARISKDLLVSLLDYDSGVFENLTTHSVKVFKKEKNLELHSKYYRENFIKIILTAIHHYSKIYKFGYYTNKKVIEHIEKIILNIFAHLTIIK
jgi:hypothetical protein